MTSRPELSARIRPLFPVYATSAHAGRPLHYLDNAASSLKPQCVIDEIARYYSECPANVHRASHWLADEATDRFEAARSRVARFLNATHPGEIIFTRGTTESLNLVAHAWAAANMQPGETILLTELEHHSNMIPWRLVAQAHGLHIDYVPVSPDGTLDPDAVRTGMKSSVRLFSYTAMSNVTGVPMPLQELSALAREKGIVFCLDAAQAVAHRPLDVRQLDCDFLAFSAHKMFGPTGVGVLYARESRQQQMRPFLGGGDMINSVTISDQTWAEPPHKFEAGTPNIAGVIGLGRAIAFIQETGRERIESHERQLTGLLRSRLAGIAGLDLVGPPAGSCGIATFTLQDVHPHDAAQFAGQAGVAIRAGNLCAQPLLRKLGLPAVCRASLSIYNNTADIEALAEALDEAARFFHGS